MAVLANTRQEKLDRTNCVHTPCYCEENVYLLIKQLAESGRTAADLSDLSVVFVSNERKQVLMWRQQAGTDGDGACVWDYHVFLVQICQNQTVARVLLRRFRSRERFATSDASTTRNDSHGSQKRSDSQGGSLVWDLDTTLPFPVPFSTYYDEAFQPRKRLYKEFERLFRVVPADLYLKHFWSDRSHMRRPDGSWMAPPPPFTPILKPEDIAHTLFEYVSMRLADCDGIEGKETEQKSGVIGDAELQARNDRTFGIVHNESTFLYCFM